MKKYTPFIVLFFICMSSLQLTSQTGWEKVLAQPYNNYFTDVWFVSGDDGLWQTGWVVEYHGDIYKTEDGGETWTTLTQSFSETLSTICFVDADTGYLCTYNTGDDDGKILKSTDGGLNWTEQLSNPNYWFSSIRFKDANNGVVSGTPNMYTHDGGVTWTAATPSGDNYAYGYTDYADGDTYFAVELWNGKVGKSDDNGETWTNIHTQDGLLPNYVDFYDGMHGMTGGSNERVLITHDGGESWSLKTIDDGQGDAACYGWFDPDTLWAAGSDIYKSTNGGDTWTVDTVIGAGSHKDMFVTPTNVVYVINDIITGENSLWRKIGIPPVVPLFEASETTFCAGTAVDFTDLSYVNIISWQWTFEGGTPASSTDQNPTITYNSGGQFDVTLTVTNGDGQSETLTMANYIEVFELPLEADMPEGEDSVCTGQYYVYSTTEVLYAQDYEWEISPSDAGEITADGTEASLAVADDWIGDFTLKVRATNLCGEGDWSELLECTVFQSPEEFVLQGGGGFCEGSEGVEITLSGSQTGLDYELYLDGSATGQIIAGTGDELSFGNQTTAGFYEALAYNSSCSLFMSDQVEVVVFENPQPVVDGLNMVCDWSEETYEVTDTEGSVYTWEISGGEITEGQGTYMISVAWNGEGSGTVIVEEETVEGCSGISDQFDVVIDDCTAITENAEESLKIYPSPAKQSLNISFDSSESEAIKILIYNHTGQLMISEHIQGNKGVQNRQIDISELSRGLYIIKLQQANSYIVKQFIKN